MMNMGSSATTSSASSSSTGAAVMMMDMNMNMNTYFTTNYLDYSVLFKHLKAHSQAGAFGIFVLIFVVCFVYKLTGFTLWYLELKWNSQQNENLTEEEQLLANQHGKNRIMEFFVPNARTFLQDTVRMCLIFWSTLLVYCLMLVAMTYILTYFFAIILGLSLFEVLFNRVKIIMLREKRLRAIAKSNAVEDVCECGTPTSDDDDDNSNDLKFKASNNSEASTLPEEIKRKSLQDGAKKSCCRSSNLKNENEKLVNEIQIANEIGENSRANADQMDSNLEPSNQFM